MTSKNRIDIDGTLPHQINAPSFKGTPIKMKPPFINSYGVTIGDSYYTSKESPLENWSEETDPAIMSGSEWVHPTNDIGWNTLENHELLENLKQPERSEAFMHPTINTGKDAD
ncbi:DUF3905 domain-containing protein [Niallia sp. XMNu-256]|uniref:DUF3905 domain-containing protein n=1 Tax=Niallia sp. XMNu-256 TaxID=3082444 RepID=UPI0030D2C15B